jgi:hypothetical protein
MDLHRRHSALIDSQADDGVGAVAIRRQVDVELEDDPEKSRRAADNSAAGLISGIGRDAILIGTFR